MPAPPKVLSHGRARPSPSPLLPQESPPPTGLASQRFFFLCRDNFPLQGREFPPHHQGHLTPLSQPEVGFTLTASSKNMQSTLPQKQRCPPRSQGEEGDPQNATPLVGNSPTTAALSSTPGLMFFRSNGREQPGQQIAFQPKFHAQQIILLT